MPASSLDAGGPFGHRPVENAKVSAMAKRATAKSEARKPERLSSVASAIRLLKAFSEDEVDIGISDLARRLGIAKSSVHRLATTLAAGGRLGTGPTPRKNR